MCQCLRRRSQLPWPQFTHPLRSCRRQLRHHLPVVVLAAAGAEFVGSAQAAIAATHLVGDDVQVTAGFGDDHITGAGKRPTSLSRNGAELHESSRCVSRYVSSSLHGEKSNSPSLLRSTCAQYRSIASAGSCRTLRLPTSPWCT